MKCFICNCDMSEDIKIKMNFDFSSNYKPNIFHCQCCGLRQLDPMLSQIEYNKVYNHLYFSGENNHCGKIYEESTSARKLVYKYKIDELSNLYPFAQELLDIGAAKGDFLSMAHDKFNCHGIELSKDAIQLSLENHGIIIKQGSTSDIKKIFDFKFDIVHMHHVFEHLIEPEVFLENLKNNIDHNTVFMLEVPHQFNSLIEAIRIKLGFPSKLSGLHAIHHPYFYTPKSLKKLLENFGYEIISMKTVTDGLKNRRTDKIIKSLFRKPLLLLQEKLNKGSVIEVICKLRNN